MSKLILFFLLLVISCLSWGCKSSEVPNGLEPQMNNDLVLAMKQSGDAEFSVVLANLTANEISIGEMHSGLGFDQFTLSVIVGNEKYSVKRKELAFTRDVTNPLRIPSGSYQEIKIDLADDTWEIQNDFEVDWKNLISIKITYSPNGCALSEERSGRNLFDKQIEGHWLALR